MLLTSMPMWLATFNGSGSAGAATKQSQVATGQYALYEEALASVVPEAGFQSRISLGESIPKLVRDGILAPKKFLALYDESMQSGLAKLLDAPSYENILLTRANSAAYVNLLWPVGLANRIAANANSPINSGTLSRFASTGGWTLGDQENGAAYFNGFSIVSLTADQEALAVRVAKTTYRPCCNNSTFYQDCNHGSALFGLLQLGAAQGLNAMDLYREALAFNSFWFSEVYLRTALYFRILRDLEWAEVDPQTVMGFEYSASGPWRRRVLAQIEAVPDLMPPSSDDTRCGI